MKTATRLIVSITVLIGAVSTLFSAEQKAQHARALPFSGTWGVRILHPTAYDKSMTPEAEVNAENFDVDVFMEQIDQLTTINHVVINIGRGHQASWYASPYPEMAAIMGDDLFPERDLFAELLDALKARDLKVLVYFSVTGMDRGYLSKEQLATWKAYLESEGLSHNEGVAQIMEYYSMKFGDKIDGWWVDRVNGRLFDEEDHRLFATALRSGNPNAVIAMHRKTGYPIVQGTAYCDFTAGHPIAVKVQPTWTPSNVAMVEHIESGPWLNIAGEADLAEGTALGAILMPFQEKWRNGAAGFPTDQAIDWTLRTMQAGGMYTWAIAREGYGFALPQFKQLVEINAAIEASREESSSE
ncbi:MULTISPECIES: hypothetical protein [unclassified Lentimonas]|uniref:hypothetical protein n=1 Tax=unclassified Lentimonas TaxID=2630993 RepID=UPI00132BB551|nr:MULTISPECIES: hypothetical protein [unclassified Lentimonas]CAA6678216.1 Unannotated [Lentimonas sp. CC4]CAA6684888.1 Unannotated [Lentimonas sp. CC6]CAA7076757.1 Unannotated [Lentimonas sp. CC4]CAA7170845.1 Unannotated [Lentimonas sp. CC21]CAA7179592.1 Unannotated [Lentimonas sp. CC8]